MKTEAQIALAVTAGYVLGRFHKLKWAVALGTMAGGKRLASKRGGLLAQGTRLLESSPELSKLTDEMRGRLVEAGKAAAVAVVSRRIDSLSDTLRERSESMSAGGKRAATDEAEDGPGKSSEEAAARGADEFDGSSGSEDETAEGRNGRREGRVRSRPSPSTQGTRPSRGEPRQGESRQRPRNRGRSAAEEGPGRPPRRGTKAEDQEAAATRRRPTGSPSDRRSTPSRARGDGT
jgi:hypothetical protein